MLELVGERAEGHAPYEIDGPDVLIHDARWIWNQHVKHLGEVAARASLNRAGGRGWEQVATVEESADVEVLAGRSQLVHRPGEKHDDALIVVLVRRRAEVECVDRIYQRVESRPEVLVVLRRKSVGRVCGVGDDDRPIRDRHHPPGPHIWILAGRGRIRVELEETANLRKGGSGEVEARAVRLLRRARHWDERRQLALRAFPKPALEAVIPLQARRRY